MRVIARAMTSNGQLVAVAAVKVLDIMKNMDEYYYYLLFKISSLKGCYCCCIAWASLIAVVTAE